MSYWIPSNRKFPDDIQLEFCDLCGNRVPAAHRTLGVVKGFYGRWLCPDCAKWGQNPAYQDYGDDGTIVPGPEVTEPHSGVDWISEAQED